MDFDIFALSVILALALAALSLVGPAYHSQPSLSAIYRYWPQYYNFTANGDAAALAPLVGPLTCWLYAENGWAQISNGHATGISIKVLRLICR